MSDPTQTPPPDETLRLLEGALDALEVSIRDREERARRRRRRLRRLAFVVGAALALLFIGINVAVWGSFVDVPLVSNHNNGASTRSSSGTSANAVATEPRSTEPRLTNPEAPTTHPATEGSAPSPAPPVPGTTHGAPPVPAPNPRVTFRMMGARGDSWALVRLGDSSGPIAYSGIVKKGSSVTVRGARLWVRFGAVGNLDLEVNGKPVRPTHSGTVDAIVTDGGLSG